MAGVVFIFVREDASDVEALADAFDRAGYAVGDSEADALNIIVWSRSAMRCDAFRSAANHAAQTGRVVVASLIATPPRDFSNGASIVDISAWDGRSDEGLDPLFYAAFDVINPARANVIALPGPASASPPTVDPPSSANVKRAAWEAPLPTTMLRPVDEHVEAEKLGAPSPRRDFRRLRAQSHGRAHAAVAFAVLALIAGASFALTTPAPTPASPHARVSVTQDINADSVSLDSASAEAIGLADVAPVEPARLFEPGQQVGHAGFEPPSARSVRRAAYAPSRNEESQRLMPTAQRAREPMS